MNTVRETIAAIATAQGRGGVGIVRLSGPLASQAGQAITGRILTPRHAHYGPFRDNDGLVLDEGIALFFPGRTHLPAKMSRSCKVMVVRW